MKITIRSGEFDEREERDIYEVIVDGSVTLGFLDGEPEDANLSRDFSDVKEIPGLIRMAYEAGKNGEELDLNYREYKEDE